MAVPLKALGGWEDADWFCTSALTDDEVVGFTLPKIAGGSKQNFRLAERAARAPARGKGTAPVPTGVTTIGALIDAASPTHAASFRRVSFLFEGAVVLYFARLPLAKLKVRAANTLRRELVAIGHRACVLHLEAGHAIAMFWPASEAAITAFVDGAAPPHPIHPEFIAGVPATARGAAPDRERAALRRTNASLLKEIAGLRAQIGQIQQTLSPLDAMEQLGLDDARLRRMLVLLHPDKHGGSVAATEAATWVNSLRDLLRKKA